ncbi:Rieske (2Fe-2S) protein [soil metagenome]
MQRRAFIKSGCVLALATGCGVVLSSVSGCSPGIIYKTGIIENKIAVPLTLFSNGKLQIIRPAGMQFDIALRKEDDTTYSSFLMRCTHAENQLLSTGTGFTCALHGSVFNADGSVTKGPAEYPLKKYRTEVIEENIIIHLN